jgi:nucleotide-binding universal stress UspA family protein
MLAPTLILSPIDFSEPSMEAFETALDLAARFGSDLLLVHVVPAIPKLPRDVSIFKEHEYEQELIRGAERRLNELRDKVSAKGMRAKSVVGLANEPGMEIIRIAEHEHADLIVIATHGMTGWHRLAFGSVTEKVVRTAGCPVLVLRAPAQPKVAETPTHDTLGSA